MVAQQINGFYYDKDDNGIVTVTMDMEGPVNAMNDAYRQAMSETVDQLYQEEGLIGVVFTSAKKTFFAGGDLKQMLAVEVGQEQIQYERTQTGKTLLRRLEKLEVPVVAAINGAALGGGLEICLACNHRVILNSANAVIGLPEVTLGLLPGAGGIVRSIHMFGLEKALPILLEGRPMQPAEALSVGYVDEVVEDERNLVATAKAWILNNPASWAQPWDKPDHSIPGGDFWNPKIKQILSTAPAKLYTKTRGLLPAPEKILSVAGDTMCVAFDAALRIEARALAYLITSPQAKNIITSTFIQMPAIKKGASRPRDIETKKVRKLGILGAGMMGRGIAFASADVGIEVVLKDVSLEAAKNGKAYCEKLLDKSIARGQASEEHKAETLRRINATDRYDDLLGCDLIVEAVFESIDLKAQVTKEAEAYLKEGGVFASNTSTLPITMLSGAARVPENFIGIHFFSPVERMPLVEIICGESTTDETLARAFDYARQIRKTPIVVNDSLGFFTSRVFGTFMDEGARLLTEGVDAVVIDAMGKQLGMPVGPLTVQDEVSLQLGVKVANTHREMGVFGSKFDTSVRTELGERLINEFGRGGRYHGGGFYEYDEKGEKYVWPKLYELFYNPELDLSNDDIKDRLLFRQVIESLKCLQEGVLRNPADGNVGSLLGIGAPKWTGGFIQFVNTYGLKRFVDRCRQLEDRYGERFKAPAIVTEYLAAGELFL